MSLDLRASVSKITFVMPRSAARQTPVDQYAANASACSGLDTLLSFPALPSRYSPIQIWAMKSYPPFLKADLHLHSSSQILYSIFLQHFFP
jgi:hypothetical protein